MNSFIDVSLRVFAILVIGVLYYRFVYILLDKAIPGDGSSLRVVVLGVGVAAAIPAFAIILQSTMVDRIPIERGTCAADISIDMAFAKKYCAEHDRAFPAKFSDLFTADTLASPNDRRAVANFDNGKHGRDYPSWDAMAAAVDSGKLEDEYHYLGAGLGSDADPSTVIILCDSFPGDIIAGLADGESVVITGEKAAQLMRQFDQGMRLLVLRDN